MKAYGIIYKHTNKLNGKVYIGQTIQINNVQRRFRHQDNTYNSYKSCPAFYNALVKHGWENFTTELILTCFDRETLNRSEEFFINHFNCIAPNGYNTNKIVDGTNEFSEETKKKISESKKKYYSQLEEKPVAPNKKEHIVIDGIEHKECAKCKEVKTLENFGVYKKRWDGLHNYCKACNNWNRKQYTYEKLTEEELKKSYEGRQEKAAVKLKDLYEKEPERRVKIAQQRSKGIIATNIETGESIEFQSAKEAKQFGFDNTNIGKAIKSGSPYKNHIWKFKE